MQRIWFNSGSALALFAALTAFASSAEAQRASGPFSGILNAVSGDSDTSHSLDARGALFGAWDDTLSRTDGDVPVDERFLRSGGSTGVSGSLSHVRRSQRFTWQSNASSSARLYGAEGGARAGSFNGTSSLNSSLSRRISISASGGWTYSPYYNFSPEQDGRLSTVGAFGGGFNVATAAERNTLTSGDAGLNVRLSRRGTLSVSANATQQRFVDQQSSIDRWAVQGQYQHTLTRSLGFHAGFGREQATYAITGAADVTSNRIDVGVDYGDALRFSRRTSLTFSTSTSAVQWSGNTYYRFNGSATLGRGFGRSGSAALSYERGTSFNAGFREPILQDQISAGVSNQFNRRISWSGQAGYVRGGIGFTPAGGHYQSYSGGGGMTLAVTRRIGFFTDYSIYRYDVPAGSTVFTSLSKFSRQSVTAGLSFWAPLIADKRSTRDSR